MLAENKTNFVVEVGNGHQEADIDMSLESECG